MELDLKHSKDPYNHSRTSKYHYESLKKIVATISSWRSFVEVAKCHVAILGLEENFGSGAKAKFWVGSGILGQEQYFRSGTKFWVGSEILGQDKIFGSDAKFGSGVKFWVGSKILGWDENFVQD